MSTNTQNTKQPNEAWLRQAADLEDQYGPVSVGGMAHELGMLKVSTTKPTGVFGRFVEFARREQQLSVEDFANQTCVELAELVTLEQDPDAEPRPRTVHKLAAFLKLPVGPLMELAGLAEAKDPDIGTAALRFAARSETNAQLNPQEHQAYEEFVKVIVEASD